MHEHLLSPGEESRREANKTGSLAETCRVINYINWNSDSSCRTICRFGTS